MLIETSELSPSATYHLLTQVVVPRPIAWVVSDNDDALAADDPARWNLAPYSFFNAVASDPPTVLFSVGRSPRDPQAGGAVKDTLANLTARPRHTIALPGRDALDAVEATAAPLPPGRSELVEADVAAIDWDWDVPRPQGARVALGCTLDAVHPVADGPQRLVLSRIHRVWVDDDAVGTDAKGRVVVDATRLDPLLRLGAGHYAALGEPARPHRPAHRVA